jgi:hypothetical protein
MVSLHHNFLVGTSFARCSVAKVDKHCACIKPPPTMKKTNYFLSLALLGATASPLPAQDSLPDRPDVLGRGYGGWLDGEGFVIPGPKTADFVDTDRDKVDDRFQSGPGKPAGKERPDVSIPERPDFGAGNGSTTNPARPERPELDSALKEKVQAYKQENERLRSELKAKLQSLDNPTREQIRLVTQEFEADNQERMANQKDLAGEIKDGLEAARPERPSKPLVSEEVANQMSALRKQYKSIQDSAEQSKSALKDQLGSVTNEGRKLLLEQFRADQKKIYDDLKNIQRQIRETLESARPSLSPGSADTRPELRRPSSPGDLIKSGDRRTPDR